MMEKVNNGLKFDREVRGKDIKANPKEKDQASTMSKQFINKKNGWGPKAMRDKVKQSKNNRNDRRLA